MKRKLGKNDRIFITIVAIFLAIMGILVLYPIVYVVSASFSSPEAVISGDVVLFPVDLSMAGYKAVFRNNKVLIGFRNSLFYTVVGSLINMVMTLLAAYPLSRKDMPGCNGIMMLFTFTMIFSGGMIPNYLLIKQLGMIKVRVMIML